MPHVWRPTLPSTIIIIHKHIFVKQQNLFPEIELDDFFGPEEKIIKKPKPQYNPQSKPMIDKVIEDNKEINEDNDFQDNLKKFVPKG